MSDKKLEELIESLLSQLLVNPSDAWKRVRLGQTYQRLGKMEDAIGAFRRAVRDKPEYPEAHCALGTALAEDGKWDEAEGCLLQAIKLKPDLVDAHVELAQGYAKQSQPEKAAESFRRALELKPDLVSLLRAAAEVAMVSRKYDDANRYLTRAREQTPNDPDVLLPLGIARTELGLWADARAALDAYVAQRGEPVDAWIALARACEGLGDLRAAIVAHEKTIALRPDDVSAHLSAGKAYYQLTQYESTVRLLEPVSARVERADVLEALGESLLALKRYEEAARALGRATSLSPEHAPYHVALGRAYLGLSRDQDAADSLEQAIRLGGSNRDLVIDALLLVANAYKRLGRAPDATTALRRAVDLRPEDPALHYELGLHHEALSHFPQAFDAFVDAAARKPDFSDAHLHAARCAVEVERLTDAVAQYRAAGDRAEAHKGLGDTLRKMNDHARAEPALIAATRLDARDGEAFLWLADSQARLGKREEAISNVRLAIKARPNDPAARAIHGKLLAEANRHQEAIEEFEACLRLDPENAEVQYGLGVSRRTLSKNDLAEQAFTAAVKAAPREARYQKALGELYLDLGRNEEAIDALEQANHLRAGDVETVRALGLAHLRFGSPREAQYALEKAISLGPPVAATHVHLARALVALGRAEDARKNLETALTMEPALADAHYELGALLARANDLEGAIKHLEEATRTAVDPADAYAELARVRRKKGDAQEAILAFRQRLRARPNDVDAHFALAETYVFAERDVDALDAQEAGLRIEPTRKGERRRYGEILARLGRHRDAIAPLEAAVNEDASDPALHALLASCHEKSGGTASEIAALARAVAGSPNDAQLHKRLGLAQRRAGQRPEAIASLTRAITLDPTIADVELPLGTLHRDAARGADPLTRASELANARKYHREDADLCVDHAEALRALERFPEAAAAAKRAYELAPDKLDTSRLLGELSEAAGDPATAECAYERVVRATPDRFDAQLGLGRSRMKLGKARDAIEPLTRAVALSPEDVQALEQLGLAHEAEKRFTDARDTFARLAKLRALEPEPLRRLCAAQIALRDDEGSLATLVTLTRLVPTDNDALAELAAAQERLGKQIEAIGSYERLLEREPERVAARRALTLLYSRVDRQNDVVHAAKGVLRAGPDDQEIHFTLTRAHAALGQHELALQAATELTRIAPDHVEGLRLLAASAVALTREELAITTLERVLELASTPDDVGKLDALLRKRGAWLESDGQLDDALTTYRRARELAPNDPEVPLAIARISHALKRPQEALDLLRENLRVHPNHGGSWLLLGRLYSAGGYTKESADAYRKAVAGDPKSFEALAGLGFACAELGLNDEAIQALTRASREVPGDARVASKLASLQEGGSAIESLLQLKSLRALEPAEHRRLGLLCAAAGRHADAVDPLTSALESTPNDASLLEPLADALEALGRDPIPILVRLVAAEKAHPNVASRLGFAYARSKQHLEAARAFEVARTREAPRAEVLSALAAEYEALNDDASRRMILTALTQLLPEDLAAHKALGFAHDLAGKRDDAIVVLTRADAIAHGNDAPVRKRLAELHLARSFASAAASDDLTRARKFAGGDETLLLEIARGFEALGLGREAADTAREVLQIAPASIDAALLLGDVLAEEGDAKAAAKAYEHALQHRVDAVDALVGAARAYVALHRENDALAMLRRAAGVDPGRVEIHQLLASTHHALGQKEDALSALAEVVKILPNDGDALSLRGRLAASLGRHDEARDALERALVVRPNDPEVLLELANVRARLGLGDASLEAAEQLARAAPTDARAQRQLGEAYAAVDRHDDAIAALGKAIELDPAIERAGEKLGALLFERGKRTDDVARAAKDFERASSLLTNDPESCLAFARAQRQIGKLQEAMAEAKRAVGRRPDHVASLIFLGEVQSQLKMHAVAADSFGQAAQFDRTSFPAWMGLGLACMEVGRSKDAEEALERASVLNPNAAEAHAARGRLFTAMGRGQEAIASFERVASLRSLTGEEERALGRLHANAGDANRVIEALERAVALGGGDLDALLELAGAYETTGKKTEAIATLQKVTAVDAQHAIAHQRLGACYASLGKHEDAVRALEIARRGAPDAAVLEMLAESLFHLGRKLEGVDVLRARSALTPNDPQWHVRLGAALADVERDDDAAAAYEQALALPGAPVDTAARLASVHLAAGLRLQRKNKHEAAVEKLTRCLSVEPKNVEARLALAHSLVASSRLEEATLAAHAALTADPASLEAATLLGELYLESGRQAEAARVYEYGLQSHPNDFALAWSLGRTEAALGRVARAIAALRRAVEIDPGHLDAKRMLARALDGADARAVWESIVALEPNDREANHRLGQLLAAEGKHAAAADAFARAATPDNIDLQNELAVELEALERFTDAVAPLAIVARAMPHDPEVAARYGRALAESGRPAEAIDVLTPSARVRPNAEVFERIADCAHQLARTDESIEALENALRLVPNNARLLRKTGRARLGVGAIDAAYEHLARSLTIEQNKEIRAMLLDLCRKEVERKQDPRKWLPRLLELDPTDAENGIALARLLDADGRRKEAMDIAGRVLEEHPSHLDAAMFVGGRFARQGYHDQAADVLAAAAEHHPDDLPLLIVLGDACLACGRDAEAANALGRAVTQRSEDTTSWEKLSAAQHRLGRYEDAAASYQHVIALGRADAAAYFHLGTLYEHASQAEPAWHAYHRAFTMEPNNIDTVRRLAAATRALGRVQEAIDWMIHGLKMAPNDPLLRYALALAYLETNRRAEAVNEYEVLRQLDGNLAMQLYQALSR